MDDEINIENKSISEKYYKLRILKDKASVLLKRINVLENEIISLYGEKIDIEIENEIIKNKNDKKMKLLELLKILIISLLVGILYFSGISLFKLDFLNKLIINIGYIMLLFGINTPILLCDIKKIEKISYDYSEKLINENKYLDLELKIENRVEQLNNIENNYDKLVKEIMEIESIIMKLEVDNSENIDNKNDNYDHLKVKRRDLVKNRGLR